MKKKTCGCDLCRAAWLAKYAAEFCCDGATPDREEISYRFERVVKVPGGSVFIPPEGIVEGGDEPSSIEEARDWSWNQRHEEISKSIKRAARRKERRSGRLTGYPL